MEKMSLLCRGSMFAPVMVGLRKLDREATLVRWELSSLSLLDLPGYLAKDHEDIRTVSC
jgi:hypothetical protein